MILLCSGELVLGRAVFTERAHGAPRFVGVFQAVEHHVVEDAVMTNAVATACLGQQVGGVGHALHAASDDDISAARGQHVMGKHDGAHAGAAHFAEGHGAGADGQATFERGLASGGLTLAGHEAVAHEDFVHLAGGQPGAFNRCADGRATEVVGSKGGEVALETAHGRAGGGNDDDGVRGHGGLLQNMMDGNGWAMPARTPARRHLITWGPCGWHRRGG